MNPNYHNPEEATETSKNFGDILVRKYKGTNPTLLKLNKSRGYIGTTYFVANEGEYGVWYLDTEDGETYRIPEPENGIDEVLDLRFKRVQKEG